ncbi:hypothetical protein F4803DRAFT_557061 [Xylaria telfairii]|nr:hypothetical protein F4803DRAFT_557061 [Xylaria telfairii]
MNDLVHVALTGRRRQVEKRPRRLKNYSLAVSKIAQALEATAEVEKPLLGHV